MRVWPATAVVCCLLTSRGLAQPAISTSTPTATPAVFSTETLGDLMRLQQAALNSDYAYRQIAHLANNIGARLTGSAQAAKAVEYVANELKTIGCDVQLEKMMVPHWLRGEETAALVQYPGMAEGTTQKIIVTALGASVATPPDGLTAEVIAVKNFDELKALPRDKVAGKIVLFNYPFDKRMADEGRAGEAYGEAVVYRADGPSAAARQGARCAYVTRVGDDDFGRLCLDLWRDERVDVSGVGVDPNAHTGIYFVRHGERGHSFSYLRAGSAASRMQASDIPDRLLEDTKCLHVSGISQAISASATDTVIVSKCGNDQESSLCPSGTSRLAPAVA